MEHGADACLDLSTEPVDRRHEFPLLHRFLGGVAEHVDRDFEQGNLWDVARGYFDSVLNQLVEMFLDQWFPRVGFEAGILLRPDVLALERAVRPPRDPLAEEMDGLAPQLVAVAL